MSIVEIPVKHSFAVAIVDDCDKDLRKLKWGLYSGGIHCISMNEGTPFLGRMVLARKLGRPLKKHELTNYVNHNIYDCRRNNLRLATQAQICQHRRKMITNKSGYKGVYARKGYKKWYAAIMVEGKMIQLGGYVNKYDAYVAYCKAAEKYHGEFACFE